MLLLAKNPVRIVDGIISSGEVEHGAAFGEVVGFWKVDDELFIKDIMIDDQSLIVDIEERGLVIIAGCAHAGIINTIKHSQKLMGVKHVHAVVGGFHLKDSKEEIIKTTIHDLTEINPDFIYPCHCTGSKAIRQLTRFSDDRCKPLRVGEILEI